jgi:uncharacterized protein (TIGR02217 family)
MTIPTFPSLAGRSWPLTRAPIWKTLKQDAVSGKGTRIPLFTFPRYQWTVPFTVLRTMASLPEFQTLIGFVNSLNGGAGRFYFTDPNDNAVVAQSFGAGDGSTSVFQLVRSFGGYSEPVQCISGAPTISVAGTPTSAFTLGALGIVTFTTAPAAGAALTWSGSFNWLCSLDDDTVEFSGFMSGFYEVQKLSWTSIKL